MLSCTLDWLHKRLQPTTPRIAAHRISVGLHVWWGDVKDDPGIYVDSKISTGLLRRERVVPLDTAENVVNRIKECGPYMRLRVYMQRGNKTLLQALGDNMTVVDSGDAFNGLLGMADNHVLIMAEGSYSMLAHQLSTGGVTVVPTPGSPTGTIGCAWELCGTNKVYTFENLESHKIPCEEFNQVHRNQGIEPHNGERNVLVVVDLVILADLGFCPGYSS